MPQVKVQAKEVGKGLELSGELVESLMGGINDDEGGPGTADSHCQDAARRR